VNPLYVEGASPQRAAPATSGPAAQPRAVALARAKELSAQFTAQIEASMAAALDSLTAEANAEEGAEESEDGTTTTTDDAGLGDLAQLQARTGMGASAGAGAGDEAALAQELLAAIDQSKGAVMAAPVTGTAAAGDAKANAAIVAQVAREQGVDPVAAVAMMLVESGGNARSVGDGGTSFGLFQLHEGGMLTAAGLTSAQAFDPRTNATVSLKSLAHERAQGPNRSPGTIAAASQRPADPAGYARKVDAMMDRARALLGR